MPSLVDIFRFVNIFCAAITAGGLVMVLMGVYPAMRTFEPKMTARIHQAIDLLPDSYMRPSTILSGVCGVLILVLHGARTPLILAYYVIGILGTLGIIVTSEFFNVRINAVVKSWAQKDYVAPEYPAMLDRWHRFHIVRTSSSLLALTCYLVAELTR
ncbi:MAG: DUF1772 domain-containing protein [Acidobacteriia bacterium]|nr:DUF1772 domain-containing protein [Terriglobia bacterium]